MNKTCLLIILPFLVSLSSFAQTKKTDWELMKLTGAIKTIYENSFEIVEDSALLKKGSIAGIVQYNFNPQGYLTEQVVNNKDWETIFRVIYFYEENNRLSKKEIYGKNGSLYYYKTYTYDPGNYTVKEMEYLPDGTSKAKTILRYSNDGNLIEEKVSDFLAPVSFVINYEYDDKGNLAGLKTNRRDITLNRETYEYDESGNLLKTNYFKDDSAYLYVEYKYVFDKLINWIKIYEVPSIQHWDQSYFRERNITYY